MRKYIVCIVIALAVLICLLVYNSDDLGSVIPIKSVVSLYADDGGNFYFIETNDSDYSYYGLDKEGNTFVHGKLKSQIIDNNYSCNGIVADYNGNIYIASYEKDDLQNILAKYVQVFDADGTFTKNIFETRIDSGGGQVETLKSLQFINGKISMFEMMGAGNLLHYEYDIKTDKESRTEYVISDGVKMVEALYAASGDIFYTSKIGEIFKLSNNETTKLDVLYGDYEKVVPLRLSYNEGRLFFTDVHNFNFVSHDLLTGETNKIYGEYDIVGSGEYFRNLRFVRWYGGKLYGHSPIFSEKGFVMSIGEDSVKVETKSKAGVEILLNAAEIIGTEVLAIAAMAALYLWLKKVRSLFIKQLVILSILMALPIVILSAMFADNLYKQITNEINYQLYSFSSAIAVGIDGYSLMELDFPNDINSDFVKKTEANIIKAKGDFEPLYVNAVTKDIFYTVYTIKDSKIYFAFGFDYISGMRDDYMLEDSNYFLRDNNDFSTRSATYRDKYGTWLIYRSFIMAGDTPVGLLEIGTRNDLVREKVFVISAANIVIAFAIAACGMFVVGFALKRTLAGLKKLKEGLSQMTDGNWHVRVNINTDDEIEDIANDFNRMSSRIEKYVDTATKLNEAYKRFVPEELFTLLDKNNIFEVKPGDRSDKNISLMSVSVKNFHSISKNSNATECFNMLNSVYYASSNAINNKGGFVESFGGYGLRAVFTHSTGAAVDSALAITEKIAAVNKSNNTNIKLNMTLQNGDSMIGIAGSAERMSETVISETVNNVFVLENITERYDINLLVTETAFEKIENKDKYSYYRIGRIKAEGGYIWLYDFTDCYEPNKRTLRNSAKTEFEQGLMLLTEKDYINARNKFAEVLKIDSTNELAKLYLFACEDAKNNKYDTSCRTDLSSLERPVNK